MTIASSRIMRVAALSLVLLATVATVVRASHTWGNYHWARTSNPFTLKLGDNVTSTWDSYLSTASSQWSQSTVLNTSIVAGSAKGKNCRPTSGQVEVCNGAYGANGWLGVAQIWASGSHITQGVVKMNDTYFNTSTYNTPAWRNFVMCQEVGHTLGLDHQDENFDNPNLGTCMDYTSNPNSNQFPNQHDYDQLATIYSHLDSTTTVSSATASQAHPPAMNNIELEGPGQWGRLVAASKRGLAEIYEADFGGGHKVITFVTWAAGEARGNGRQ